MSRISDAWCLAGFLFAAVLPAQTSGLAQTTQDELEQSRQLYAAHDLIRSEALARQYLAVHPDSAAAGFLLGRILQSRHRPKESLTWFTRAAALERPTGEDLRTVAIDYVLLNDYADARKWLTKSVEFDPSNAAAWYDLGRTMMMLGDLHGARAPLERSLALHPRQGRAANNLGLVAEADNRPEDAEGLYRQAIEWDQDKPHPDEQPYLNLGTLLLARQQPAQALPLLARAAALAPDNAKCHEQLALAEEKQGDSAAALVEMETATRLQPQSAPLHFELGQMYRRAGKPEKAKTELELSGKLYGTHSSDPNP
jgi:tetratricopeptide (TPR) repeat protein